MTPPDAATQGSARVLPPFRDIAELLHEGRVIPFLGAGVNTRPDPAERWRPDAPFLPRGSELSDYLAERYEIPTEKEHERTDLSKVSSYGAEVSGRDRLRSALRRVFARAYAPCALHHYLAGLPGPLLIVTTNYDDLTEQAFQARGKPYHLVVHPTDRPDSEAAILWWKPGAAEPTVAAANTFPLKPGRETIIYKMHGTVCREPSPPAGAAPAQPGELEVGVPAPLEAGFATADPGANDSYVITEDDYVDFLSRMVANTAIPALFTPYLHTTPFLFLGYGLNDWNLRVMLRNLQRVLSDAAGQNVATFPRSRPSWAIQYQPSEVEKALWQSRGVRIFDMDVDELVQRLSAFSEGA